MSRRVITNTIALLAGIALGVYFVGNRDKEPTQSERMAPSPHTETLTELPDFSLPDLAGEPQPIGRWAGKVLVLNFWATWCPPCRKEMPGFIALQEELGGKGLQFVGIAIDSPEAVREFAAEQNINYPILIGDESAIRISKQLGNRFQGLPFSVIFDRAGGVVYVQAGELKTDTIREKITALL